MSCIKNIPFEKKLYQLIITRLNGNDITNKSYCKKIEKLIRKGIGGFILFGGLRNGMENFIKKIQSISEVTLLIASDIERGVGQQINGTTIFPCQMAVSAAIKREKNKDILLLHRALKAIINEAKDMGINMPLIPVMDINQAPDNPIICTRAFSDNAEDVSWLGREYIKLIERYGLISCAKHFPGHGDTSIDSHIALPVIRKTYNDLITNDIIPFKAAIHAGVSSIMVGHLSIPSIDKKPASISEKIIKGILRDRLGFHGLVLTDALTMNALKGIKNISGRCIKAGNDILLHPVDPDLTVKEIMVALDTKMITEKDIERAVKRILKIKQKIRKSKPIGFDYETHLKLSSLIIEKSITLVKNTPEILPLTDEQNVSIIFAGDETFFSFVPLYDSYKNIFTLRHQGGFNLEVVKEVGSGGLSDIIILIIFSSISAWKGSSGLLEDEKKTIQRLIKKAKKSIVVSFGNPYILNYFQKADILIAAYDISEQAQIAVKNCLVGKREFQGRLPVKINV